VVKIFAFLELEQKWTFFKGLIVGVKRGGEAPEYVSAQLSRAATAGRVLPSISARKAPPPVDI
jgi:hypothetical protein